MDRLEAMRVFVAVAEAQGFAAAARALSMSPPAVTRSIAGLEEHLGTRLLRRTTRVVRLTDAGVRYLADCKRILGEIEEAEASAASDGAELQGTLHVTASVNFGRLFVAPVVYDFLALHPRLAVRTLLVDRVVSLVEEGIDVGVRIAHLPDSSLRAARVGSVRRVIVASPSYLKRRGRPAKPADLEGHDTIAFTTAGQSPQWTLISGGKPLVVAPQPRLTVNTADAAIGAARAGLGLVRVLSYMVQAELRAHQLEVILADLEPPPVPVQLVHAGGDRTSARVRAFVDFAGERLRRVAAQGAFGTRASRPSKERRAAGG